MANTVNEPFGWYLEDISVCYINPLSSSVDLGASRTNGIAKFKRDEMLTKRVHKKHRFKAVLRSVTCLTFKHDKDSLSEDEMNHACGTSLKKVKDTNIQVQQESHSVTASSTNMKNPETFSEAGSHFWEVNEICPTLLGSPNSFAIWNPPVIPLCQTTNESDDSDSTSDSSCVEKSFSHSKYAFRLQPFGLASFGLPLSPANEELIGLINPKSPGKAALFALLGTNLDEETQKPRCILKDLVNINVKQKKHRSVQGSPKSTGKENLNIANEEVKLKAEHTAQLFKKNKVKRAKSKNKCFIEDYLEEFSYSPIIFNNTSIQSKLKNFEFFNGLSHSKVVRQMKELESRVDSLKFEAEAMRLSALKLSTKFKKIEEKTCRLLTASRQFHSELNDVRYLEELIYLLNGEINQISLRNWPFAVAHENNDGFENINLII